VLITLQLIDMGFSREQAMEALVHTNSLEQATEYCLTHQQPVPAAASAQVYSSAWLYLLFT